jgi:hypothetical protein
VSFVQYFTYFQMLKIKFIQVFFVQSATGVLDTIHCGGTGIPSSDDEEVEEDNACVG